jgi:NAD(P)H dehydrogenase (quinone)
MENSTILVTGATGATGGNAVQALRNAGLAVRALVRKDDARTEKLRAVGADIVTGDLLDIDAVRAALAGVRAAYFVYPIVPGLLDATAYFAQAAKEVGVTAIVNTSQMTSRRDSKSHAAQNHWVAERLFDRCGVPVTHLRPTLFAEWMLYPFSLKSIVEKDTLALPFGTGRFAPIASEDTGRVVAAILADPVPHAGSTYQLFGPVEMDGNGIATAMSEVLGRKIGYSPMDVKGFQEMLAKIPRLSEYFAQHVGAIAVDCQNGITAGTNGNVEQLTGRRPLSVQEFVEKRRASFEVPAIAGL